MKAANTAGSKPKAPIASLQQVSLNMLHNQGASSFCRKTWVQVKYPLILANLLSCSHFIFPKHKRHQCKCLMPEESGHICHCLLMYNLHIQVYFQQQGYEACKVRGLVPRQTVARVIYALGPAAGRHCWEKGEPAPRHFWHQVFSLPETFKLSPRVAKQDTLREWQLSSPSVKEGGTFPLSLWQFKPLRNI